MILTGVIGWPIGHSRSPKLHNWWIKHYGINGTYVPLAVHPAYFFRTIQHLGHIGFRGINITMPHKEAALQIVDEVETQARCIGAINTIIYTTRGSILGVNTDGFGFIESLYSHCPNWNPKSGPAVILGAGGAARAIIFTLIRYKVLQVRLVNRSTQRAESLARDVGGPISIINWSDRMLALEDASLLVNTTILGMIGAPPLEVNLRRLPTTAVVMDIVYVPFRTSLLETAKERGNTIVEGINMLLHQARPGFTTWFGIEPIITKELQTLLSR